MKRRSATSHHERFHLAFFHWRMPREGQPRADPAHAAKALEDWLRDWPGNAELIQRFAAGAAAVAEMTTDWPVAMRLAGVGLRASQTGALTTASRLHTAVVLALQTARAAMELNSVVDAREHLERAAETLGNVDDGNRIREFLQWQMHLLGAELSEASLERELAAGHFEDAWEISRAYELGAPHLSELFTDWITMLYGQLPQSNIGDLDALFAHISSDMRMRTALGRARTSRSPATARAAVNLCMAQDLPLWEPGLAMHGIVGSLPADEIDDAARKLFALTKSLQEPRRSTCQVALLAHHAEAWFDKGDLQRAADLLTEAGALITANPDGISAALLLAVLARVTIARGESHARPLLDALVRLRAEMTKQLTGSRWDLPFRVACEPAVLAGVEVEARTLHAKDDVVARRSLSLLLDALREPQAFIPPDDAASDRIGRLVAAAGAVKESSRWLVLVLQAVTEGVLLLAVGGNKEKPLFVTLPDRALRDALLALSRGSVKAVLGDVGDERLEVLGRAAYEALPALVQERLQRVDTLIFVPDFGAGQDGVPIELFHDGNEYLGATKVIARCLSLTHVLHAVEAPLVVQPSGKHGLCVKVGEPPGLAPLKHAEAEFQTVRSVLVRQAWDVAELRETAAEPNALLDLLPLANLVHIACHGEGSVGAEALVLGGGQRLAASEFITRHPVRCVTYLNACSVARGRYLGGGVSRGMAYAFARAGAPSVLANLSPVEDESAAQLAEAFYLAAQGSPVGEALRSARQLMQAMVGAALWSPTILIGDPWARIDGRADDRVDATAELFGEGPLPTTQRVAAGTRQLAKCPDDLRLAAALRFSLRVEAAGDDRWEDMATLGKEIGHDVGEAHCLMEWAKALRQRGDKKLLGDVLARTVSALTPLRNAWKPAFEAHARLQKELRELDPTYKARELHTSTLAQDGISVNDRSDPAVDAVLRISDALHDHEEFWRGAPQFLQPDLELTSVAHNAVVLGFASNLFDSGAESDHADHIAQRLGWRGLVPQECVPNLARILSGLLHFVWGQQGVKHLEHAKQRGHVQVILLALRRVSESWAAPETSAGLTYALEVSAALDRATPSSTESKFARARAALRGGSGAASADHSLIAAAIGCAVDRCRQKDPMASAELAAWIFGDLQRRIDACERAGSSQQDATTLLRTVYESALKHDEEWFMPYLMEGFTDVRQEGGLDVFRRWSQSML